MVPELTSHFYESLVILVGSDRRTKVEAVQVNYVVSRSPSNLTTPNSLTTPQAVSPCLWVPNITQLWPECFKGTENPISASMDQRDQRSTNSRVSRDRGSPPSTPHTSEYHNTTHPRADVRLTRCAGLNISRVPKSKGFRV